LFDAPLKEIGDVGIFLGLAVRKLAADGARDHLAQQSVEGHSGGKSLPLKPRNPSSYCVK